MFDLVGADNWTVRRSVFADSAKQGGDGTSYIGFFKGAGRSGIFEQNLVLCRWRHRGGARVGLSLGGGGTGPEFCRDKRCSSEHIAGTIRNNIIAGCSDAGIYLNKAADARIHNNLLYRTRGIDARFAETTATIVNNIIDGRILKRDGAEAVTDNNLISGFKAVGLMSVAEGALDDPANGSFAFNAPSHARAAGTSIKQVGDDLCGRPRKSNAPGIGPFSEGRADCISGAR
jgi:hypothetical protein